MSSNRSSRLLIVLVAVLLSASVAAGVTVDDETSPAGAQIGATVDASYTLAELYQNPSREQWTLLAQTELRNVTWTFELVDQTGNVVETNNVDGQNATQSLSVEEGVSEVEVSVTGTVPPVEEYTYEPAPTFVVAELTHTREGGTSQTLETYEARHYTTESREARRAIESAQSAIDDVGGHDQAEQSLQSAISAYEGENFDNAVQLAERAETEATQARQNRQRNQLILYGVVGLVLIGIVLGAIYWYASRDTGSRL